MNMTAATVPTVAPYNPLSGKETLDVIMRKVYQDLVQHQDFSDAITYPAFRYHVRIEVDVPDLLEPKIMESSGSEGTLLSKAKRLFHNVQSQASDAPDEDRAAAGLEMPRPTLTSGGIVDRPSK